MVLVTQHFGKELRIARNNAHYIVLLRNPAGALQIRNIANQMFPGKHGYFMEAYRTLICIQKQMNTSKICIQKQMNTSKIMHIHF